MSEYGEMYNSIIYIRRKKGITMKYNFKIMSALAVLMALIMIIPAVSVSADPVYNGITIDGDFSDWDAVTKYDAECPNEWHKNCLSQAAMVFDGDYAYIYIKDGDGPDWEGAFGAGLYSNARYSIVTDLGYELVFQLTRDGKVNGVDGIECVHADRQWEISVPKSVIPEYNKTISFGLYEMEPFVKDVANLKDDGSDDNVIYDIRYDGLYGDWDRYPHVRLGYTTAGTHHNIADGYGAIYSDGNIVLGHVFTELPAHLNEKGGELTSAVSFKLNDSKYFYARMVTVDENGNINWNPRTNGLDNGTYEFYIFAGDEGHDITNMSQLNDYIRCYGKMMVTIGDSKDQCEYYIDFNELAKKYGWESSDFKQIEAQFGRIGQQWIGTAGASSGAWLGLFICICAVCGVVVYKNRKGNKQVKN